MTNSTNDRCTRHGFSSNEKNELLTSTPFFYFTTSISRCRKRSRDRMDDLPSSFK